MRGYWLVRTGIRPRAHQLVVSEGHTQGGDEGIHCQRSPFALVNNLFFDTDMTRTMVMAPLTSGTTPALAPADLRRALLCPGWCLGASSTVAIVCGLTSLGLSPAGARRSSSWLHYLGGQARHGLLGRPSSFGRLGRRRPLHPCCRGRHGASACSHGVREPDCRPSLFSACSSWPIFWPRPRMWAPTRWPMRSLAENERSRANQKARRPSMSASSSRVSCWGGARACCGSDGGSWRRFGLSHCAVARPCLIWFSAVRESPLPGNDRVYSADPAGYFRAAFVVLARPSH